ncbi:hypothetical protein [Nocardia gipuzkoensis]|uniref:hypothetical protein n=1 Tax=Nocardia gipuzkoensis TaxID=2749991 RepID=UPI00237EC10B|nr:hypothetical protein [Nocardia gipuzkoensis]MDE1673743.1 hypothetical protein [Nocardia gipuzkoensis]
MTKPSLARTVTDRIWNMVCVRAAHIRFTQPPYWLLDKGLSRRARDVWEAIARYIGFKSRKGHPFRATIAEVMHVSLSTVDRGLRELKDAGAILVRARGKRGGGRSSNEYCLLWEPLEDLLADKDLSGNLVTSDNIDLVSGDKVDSTGPATDTATGGELDGSETSGNPETKLVSGDEFAGSVFQSFQEEGGTRGAAKPVADGSVSSDSPPPSTCPQHREGTPDPCGPCKWHRLRHEAWKAERAAEQARAADRARLEAHHRRIALAAEEAARERQQRADDIAACKLCDRHGQREGRGCDHRDPEARRAAVTAARAFFQNKQPRFSNRTSQRRRAS